MPEDNNDTPLHDPTITEHVRQSLVRDRSKLPPEVGLKIDQTVRDEQARRLPTDDEYIGARYLGDPDWYKKHSNGSKPEAVVQSSTQSPNGENIAVKVPPTAIKK